MKLELVLYVFGVVLQTVDAQSSSLQIQKHFEFEDALTESQDDMWVWRSEASNMRTLHIEDQAGVSRIELSICIVPYNTAENVTMFIDDILYSNDGPVDLVKIHFNGINIANFITIEKWRSGHEWNVFRNSGNIGPVLNLRQGRYTLMLTVVTDIWGVEFDRIRMIADNQSPTADMFCGASVYFAVP